MTGFDHQRSSAGSDNPVTDKGKGLFASGDRSVEQGHVKRIQDQSIRANPPNSALRFLNILNTVRDTNLLVPYADFLESRLNPFGVCNLLVLAMRIAPPDALCAILDAVLTNISAGIPGTAFLSFADEAKDWCSFASLAERKCYCAAIWQSLSEQDQNAFWQYANGRTAA